MPIRNSHSVNRPRITALTGLAGTAAAVAALCVAPAGTALAAPAGPGACSAAGLSMSVPSRGADGPAGGMGKLAWNILLRNTGHATCSVTGWPRLQVRGAGGQAVKLTVRDVSFGSLGPVREQRVLLGRGEQAVVTVVGSDGTRGCTTQWSLGLALPGAAGSLGLAQPAAFFGPCSGGTLYVSPLYPLATLTRAISALRVSASPPVYRVSPRPEPAPCTAARMRVAASYGSSVRQRSVQILRLVSRRAASCELPGHWPTVTLRESGGTSQVAKALVTTLPRGVARSDLIAYRAAGSLHTDLTLRPGTSASVALVTHARAGGTGACRQARSATIYPTASATGAGLTVAFAKPVTFCGLPRVLAFLAGQPSAAALAASGTGGVHTNGDSPAGFWYGSDSGAPAPYSSSGGVYLMPYSPTGGAYGGYIGEIGDYSHWQGCNSNILNWNQTAYNDAQSNFNSHHVGVGAAGYWMMAGPGRESGYSSTNGTEAYNWGQAQAQRVVSTDLGQALGFPYVVMDIEDVYNHGWNEAWNGPCGGTVVAGSVPASIDRDTFNGFWDYIEHDSAYFPSVYDAGGGGSNAWSAVFGSQTLGNTMEWTYVNETSSISTFPTGWNVAGTTPVWFASAPSQCQMLWQWSGGNGQLNHVRGDFDQIDGNLDTSCL